MSKEKLRFNMLHQMGCILALHVDIKDRSEHILLGTKEEVQRYLLRQPAEIMAEQRRPLLSFLLDCFEKAPDLDMIVKEFYRTLKDNKKSPGFEEARGQLQTLLASENLCLRFVALHVLQAYQTAREENEKKHGFLVEWKTPMLQTFLASTDALLNPFHRNLEKEITSWQAAYRKNPLRECGKEFYQFSCGTLFANDATASIYFYSDESLLPLIFSALQTYYKNHVYPQRCKICGRLFLAGGPRLATICKSKKCRAVQNRANKQKFDQKAEKLPYEKAYKRDYMYWYNRVSKYCGQPDCDSIQAVALKDALFAFRKEALKRKKRVKEGKDNTNIFLDWLLMQRNVIDGLLKTDS